MNQIISQNTAVIILAAGNSSRLEHPKQLLKLNGETLLHRTVRIADESGLNSVYVVLGYRLAQMKNNIGDLLGQKNSIKIVENRKWTQGMGTSISLGIMSLNSSISSAIIAVCDQPYLSVNLLRTITKTYQENDVGIVTSRYGNGVLGVPTLFSKVHFKKLSSLQRDKGARYLLKDNKKATLSVSFPNGSIDVDTKKIAAELELKI